MNLSNLTRADKESKSKEDLEETSKEKDFSIDELRRKYKLRISEMSAYFLTEKEWCKVEGINFFDLSTSREEGAYEISRRHAIKLLSEVDKYKIFYEEEKTD